MDRLMREKTRQSLIGAVLVAARGVRDADRSRVYEPEDAAAREAWRRLDAALDAKDTFFEACVQEDAG